jgi:hypothetical protein
MVHVLKNKTKFKVQDCITGYVEYVKISKSKNGTWSYILANDFKGSGFKGKTLEDSGIEEEIEKKYYKVIQARDANKD